MKNRTIDGTQYIELTISIEKNVFNHFNRWAKELGGKLSKKTHREMIRYMADDLANEAFKYFCKQMPTSTKTILIDLIKDDPCFLDNNDLGYHADKVRARRAAANDTKLQK